MLVAALKGACPRCCAISLFEGPVHIAPRCRVCGLDYAAYPVGGRPVAILTLLVAAIIFGIAMLVEEYIYPPLLVQIIVWPLVTVGAVVALIRIVRGVSFIHSYRKKMDASKATREEDRD